MRVTALVTGGKDSALALHRVMKKGYDVKCLVAMLPKREDSWMFHYPNVRMTDWFAEAVGIPLVKAETSGVKDVELEDLKRVLAKLDVDAVVSGGISSQYQKKSIDKICQGLGFMHIAPLWHEDSLRLLEEMISLEMETVIVGVYAHGFNQTWLGRKIDESTLVDLKELNRKYAVSLVGEGGEYETMVLDAPIFKQRIELVKTEVFWKGESGYLLVRKATLVGKDKVRGKEKS